ncbi:SsgA family sporulation/cell division regulator [Streptomyces sp. S3(2020)]|uniref:SsgA family sporulation/cell division regulator n=1 Tax=Streptomyces sp. S3(2020) TaxID=2732044 RepID=UPI001489E276|nr:SsgA family sporulation/cell division regulator [Streptomyces sp. S3(2020)]NNN33109.1 SsgA family sporulation/cell division regulator [Streptomyces sp. S3(2020)]
MSVVEQYARAHIVSDADIAEDEAIPVLLRYDPDTDPRAVRVGLPGPHEWTFQRELLERGLRAPVEAGDVRVWPCGRVQAVVEFHSAKGVSVVQFESKALLRFLRRTYTATPVRG